MMIVSLQGNTDSETWGDLQNCPCPFRCYDKKDFWRLASPYGVNGSFRDNESWLAHMWHILQHLHTEWGQGISLVTLSKGPYYIHKEFSIMAK